MGPKVKEFETMLENFFSRPSVCVTNGTAALQLALQACEVGPGDEVLVPSLTYVSSFQAISATGATPVACEIDSVTFTIDLKDCDRRLTQKTKVIMPVHYAGGVGNLDQVYKFAKSYELRVIEDAAHAFGTTYKQKRIGGFGDIACFSFDGIKNITSGEGGCIVTEDQSVLEKVKDSRLLGVKNDSKARLDRQRSWLFEVEVQGWRYHMSDLMAAIGIVQLDRFDEFTQKRRTLARRYDELLAPTPRVTPLQHNYSEVVPHIYVVKIKNLCDREELRKDLLEDGIQTGLHYQPNHLLKLYQNSNNRSLPFPVTEEAFSQILTLPLHPDLQPEDLKLVSSKLLEKLNNH